MITCKQLRRKIHVARFYVATRDDIGHSYPICGTAIRKIPQSLRNSGERQPLQPGLDIHEASASMEQPDEFDTDYKERPDEYTIGEFWFSISAKTAEKYLGRVWYQKRRALGEIPNNQRKKRTSSKRRRPVKA